MRIINKNINLRGALFSLILLFSMAVSAQKTVTGVVYDETDQPLIGATVLVPGTTDGAVTDIDGNFSITVKKGNVVRISYIGYKQQDVQIKDDGKKLIVKLAPDAQMLDDVVVVGYGSVRRSDLTGSVSSVSSDAIEGYKSSTVLEALAGQVSGVQITSTDGTPGAGFDVKIRGVGTLTGDSSPLYIVDGFQVDNIDYLSDTDIESVDFLKDASSSAIYGARAANGVVLVTTKSGKKGAPKVTYNGSASYRDITKKLDVLSPYEFVKLQLESGKYGSTYFKEGIDETTGEPYEFQSLNDYIGFQGVDWQDEILKPTWSQNHSISVTGGGDQTTYSFSFSHFDEDGVFKNSSFKKNNAKMRINQKITDKISLDANITYPNSTRLGNGTTNGSGRFNILSQVLSARPVPNLGMTVEEFLHEPIDPLELEESESLAQVNPLVQAESVYRNVNSEMWQANATLTWKIIKGLTFKTSGSYSTTNTRNDQFYEDGSKEAYRNGQKPYGQTQMTKATRWANTNYLTWEQKIKKHKYDVMLGHEITYNSSQYLLGQAMDFPFDNLGNNDLSLGATPSKVATSFSDKTLLSFFARANYTYDERYLLTATVRADASTVFSPKNKWGFFPAFSAAWRIKEEQFLKDLEWLSNLKLRLGWGTVGNDRISNYLSMDLYEQSKYGLGSNLVTVLTPAQLKNSNLKWEGSTTTNIGLDLGFFDNRVNLSLDYFIKNTKDLLLAQSLPYVTGFDSQMQNVGKIQNRGLEITLNTTNIQTNKFLWRTDLNISFLDNELKSLAAGVTEMYARTGFDSSDFTGYDYIAKVGSSLGLMYGYVFDGVYQSSDFTVTPSGTMELKPGVTRNMRYNNGEVAPGVVKYKDINGDGLATDADRTVIGNALPDFYGGFTNTFNYANFDLSFMFQFSVGNDVFNATRLYSTQTKKERTNLLAEVADRWTPTNASNKVPSTEGYVNGEVYSRFVEDGSYLRLKNITLGYTFPVEWTRKFYVQKLRLYASAQNLFCLTKYTGYDPEVSTFSGSPMTPGVDWGAYPKTRVFTFGVDLSF